MALFRGVGVLLVLVLSCTVHAQLRSSANHADYLIIHSSVCAGPAALHAQWRAAKGLVSMPVDIADIAREFPAAESRQSLRDFLSYAMTTWTPPYPAFVLLLGDSNIIPTWQHVSTDMQVPDTAYHDWPFVINQNQNDTQPDAAIGRFPVSDSATAELCLAKTRYFTDSMRRGDVPLDFLQLIDSRDGDFFETIAENDASSNFPSATRRAMLSALAGSAQYASRETMWNTLRSGTRVLLYYGHGARWGWSHERLLTYDNLDSVALPASPFVVSTVACSQKALTGQEELFGTLLLRPKGGAVATIGSSGLNYAGIISSILTHAHRAMINDGVAVGSALLAAIRERSAVWEAMRMVLSGDPALRLPRDIVAGINGQPVGETDFTIHAYPNPARGIVRFDVPVSRETAFEIDIFNTLGVHVAHIRSDAASRAMWDSSLMPNGVYHYRAHSGTKQSAGTLHILQ